ncbi:MAG TPA: DAK2 domain-containing protein, partial [Actinophytocola sp.]|nr:DAK2 domain-containing protein [Actinophytocola sp.]
MLRALDAAQVRRWAVACVQSLDAHREAIDRINVYPVADGDTGSNLLHTMRAALDALLRAPAGARSAAGVALAELARGALTGARGNSGVIASQLLRGFADALAGSTEIGGAELRSALAAAAARAEAALSHPVPGTMISVVQGAAEAARSSASDDLGDVVTAAAAGAAAALERTPRQLAVLAEAGVVDAGGRGVTVLLDALVAVVAEQPAALVAAARARELPAPELSMYTAREAGSDQFAYEVMYLLSEVAGNGVDPVGRLRDTLVGLGDCVSVVGDGAGLWTVHVHCNDVGAAIEAGIETGRPRNIRVARFAD